MCSPENCPVVIQIERRLMAPGSICCLDYITDVVQFCVFINYSCSPSSGIPFFSDKPLGTAGLLQGACKSKTVNRKPAALLINRPAPVHQPVRSAASRSDRTIVPGAIN